MGQRLNGARISALPEPSRRVSIDDFYLDYLPRLWRALWPSPEAAAWRLRMGVEIAATHYTLTIDGADLQAVAQAADDLPLTLRLDRESWRTAVHDLLPRLLRYAKKHPATLADALMPMQKSVNHAALIDALTAEPGVVSLHFTDDAGDSALYEFHIASGAGPRAEIYADDGDLWHALEASGKAARLATTKIRLAGDTGYLTRLIETARKHLR